jgi:hypothetical protein
MVTIAERGAGDEAFDLGAIAHPGIFQIHQRCHRTQQSCPFYGESFLTFLRALAFGEES